MSHASLIIAATGNRDAWKRQNRLSLAGTSDKALEFFLNQHPLINELVFCLDNDAAGHDASIRMMTKYSVMGYNSRIELPVGKDFSEDLTAILTKKTRPKRIKIGKDRGCI
jgi:hypothetical protein